MSRLNKHFIILFLAAAIMIPPVSVLAETRPEGSDPQINAAYMVGDAIIARPLGLVGTAVGFGLFIISSPFALISGSATEAWDGIVVYPAKFTFTRPLGDFN